VLKLRATFQSLETGLTKKHKMQSRYEGTGRQQEIAACPASLD